MERIKVTEAARLMGVSAQFVRIGMQLEEFTGIKNRQRQLAAPLNDEQKGLLMNISQRFGKGKGVAKCAT